MDPRNGWRRSLRRTTRTTGIVLAAVAAATFSGCPTSVDFDDYESVNLIGTQGLAQGGWTPDDTTGALMNWEVVSTPPPSGSSDAVYRMEVHNLFQDGDFESGTPLVDWVDPNVGGGNAGATTGGGLDGTSLSLLFSDSRQQYYTDLTNGPRIQDGNGAAAFTVNTTYAIHFDLVPSAPDLGIELNNNNQASTTDDTIPGPDALRVITDSTLTGTRLAFPADYASSAINTLTVVDTAYSYFSFGGFLTPSQQRFVGEIDNIRFVRMGPEYYVRLSVPYSDAGRPDLIPGGTYTVSLYVRRDDDIGNAGRFGARNVALGIAKRIGSSGAAYAERVDVSDVGFSWQQISVSIPGPTFSNSSVDPGDIILDIVVSPTFSQSGPRYTDAGSIFISSPELTWNPN
jgi:hypothetical protein